MGHYAAEMRCNRCQDRICTCPSLPPPDETRLLVIDQDALEVRTLAEARALYRAKSSSREGWAAKAAHAQMENMNFMLMTKYDSLSKANAALAEMLDRHIAAVPARRLELSRNLRSWKQKRKALT